MVMVFTKESVIGGDIFNASETLKVVTINTVGAMGRGIALDCKLRYPDIYREYRKLCKTGIYPDAVSVFVQHGVILFATKLDWKKPSSLSIIKRSMIGLFHAIKENDIREIAMPPLGMVNGWLTLYERREVFKMLESLGRKTRCRINLYLPDSLYEEVYAMYH